MRNNTSNTRVHTLDMWQENNIKKKKNPDTAGKFLCKNYIIHEYETHHLLFVMK